MAVLALRQAVRGIMAEGGGGFCVNALFVLSQIAPGGHPD